MGAVKPLVIDAVQVTQGPAEIAPGGLEQQLVMVVHQTIGMHLDSEGGRDIAEQAHEGAPIPIRPKIARPLAPRFITLYQALGYWMRRGRAMRASEERKG